MYAKTLSKAGEGIWSSSGEQNKVPQSEQLKQQKSLFSQFWRLNSSEYCFPVRALALWDQSPIPRPHLTLSTSSQVPSSNAAVRGVRASICKFRGTDIRATTGRGNLRDRSMHGE